MHLGPMAEKTLLHSKLLDLYRVLDKAERRAFKKWLYSPLHNEHEGVQQIFHFLDTRHGWTATTLQRSRLWEALYPGAPYDDGRLRYLLSLSLEVLTDFVGYHTATQHLLGWQNHTVQYLAQHKLHKLAKKEIQKAQRLAQNHYPSAERYFHQFELEQWQFELEGTQERTRSTNIDAIAQDAALFFMQTTLRYACIASSQHTIKNTAYHLPMLEAVLTQVQTHYADYQAHPLLLFYYHAYYTLLGAAEHYEQLLDFRQKAGSWMRYADRRELLLIGTNYCIRQINSGQLDFARSAWEWYKMGLEEDLLLDNGSLSLFSYTNIVAIGINVGELQWVEQFITAYAPYLPEQHQDHYRSYNSAKLYFAKGKLDTAIQHLHQYEYTDLLLNLEAKVLLIKIYYQADYWEALEALLDSFRIYLGRKTKVLTPSRKANYQNIIRFTKQLVNLAPNAAGRQKLRGAIEAAHPLSEKTWLLEQL